jgi:hypothetical protein
LTASKLSFEPLFELFIEPSKLSKSPLKGDFSGRSSMNLLSFEDDVKDFLEFFDKTR